MASESSMRWRGGDWLERCNGRQGCWELNTRRKKKWTKGLSILIWQWSESATSISVVLSYTDPARLGSFFCFFHSLNSKILLILSKYLLSLSSFFILLFLCSKLIDRLMIFFHTLKVSYFRVITFSYNCTFYHLILIFIIISSNFCIYIFC